MASLTPQDFARRWAASGLSERSSYQQHFLDLCDVLGAPKPAEEDPKGEFYTFEKGVEKTGGGKGFADVWFKDHFAIEYKGNNFGGRLEGKLIVARYTTDDIIVLEPGANGDIARDNAEVPGFTKVPGSEDPLDLIEDPRNGNIYVTEGVRNPPDGTGKITLLKAADAGTPRPARPARRSGSARTGWRARRRGRR